MQQIKADQDSIEAMNLFAVVNGNILTDLEKTYLLHILEYTIC